MPADNHKKLAEALERAVKAAPKGVLRSAVLQRADRDILRRAGYLKDIVKGWYFLVRPGIDAGESTAWYASFWNFLATYLTERFGDDYCLNAVASLELQVGTTTIPRQVVAVTAHSGKTLLNLPHETSVLVYEDAKSLPAEVVSVDGLRVMPLAQALCRLPPAYFRSNPVNAELALRTLPDISALIRVVLETRSPALAGRFAGAYAFLGDDAKVRAIESATQAAGIPAKRENPFDQAQPALASGTRAVSPYAGRIQAMFRSMRDPVLSVFDGIHPIPVRNAEVCLKGIDEVYVNDAYNSLSIEGYRVSPDLIERIRSGNWNPEADPEDRQMRDAMAVKGYFEAFKLVKEAVRSAVSGKDAAQTVRDSYPDWYRALFSEAVKSGLLEAHRLAGHRNGPVYIRSSKHVPPRSAAVSDSMDALFDCLQAEKEPAVRAVLGHFLFGFIHPYFDGNGRLARFLMNFFLASAGHPWTIVRTARRNVYMAALEKASTGGNIEPFALFILEEMQVDWQKELLIRGK
jgi:hypothetical protein